MQTYTKLYHKRFPLWKKINRKMGKEAKIIYLYLLSSPFTHHSGLFEYNETMLVNTGLTFDEIEIGVSELLANRLITVDEQLEYCLITYLVENIKLDNPNQAKSLVKYLLDLEKTFLLGMFHQLIENTDTFNRIETVEEGLFNRYQTLVEPFANKDYTINIKDNTIKTIDNTIKTIDNKLKKKKEKLENKITKEEKALLEKDALSVYQFYFSNIKGGERKNTLKLLYNILKQETKESLIVAIQNYIIKQKELGNNDLKFYKAPQFFFSIANEFYKDYLGYDLNKRKMFIKEVYNINKQLGKKHVENELKRIKEIYINFITDKEISEARDIILDSSEVAF